MNISGFSLEHIRESKIGPIVLEARIRYLKELHARDKVEIKSQITKYEGKVGELLQQMYTGETMVCEATFTIGLFDLSTRRLIPPNQAWLKAIGLA